MTETNAAMNPAHSTDDNSPNSIPVQTEPVMRCVTQAKLLFPLIFLSVVFGCGDEDITEDASARMVYVDAESLDAIVADRSDTFPIVNPSTGKRTLMPGLYCSQCEKWYPVPAPDRINSVPGAGLCPETQNPLTGDGPWPDTAEVLDGKD